MNRLTHALLSLAGAVALAITAASTVKKPTTSVQPQKKLATNEDPAPGCFPFDCPPPNTGGGGNRTLAAR